MKKTNVTDIIKFLKLAKENALNSKVTHDEQLSEEEITKFLKHAIERVVKTHLDPDASIELIIEGGKFQLINKNMTVVPDSDLIEGENKLIDINLSEAQKLDPSIKEWENISSEISFEDFKRSTYSKIEQAFRFEILLWEKRRVYKKYLPLIGTEVMAKVVENNSSSCTFILEDGTQCLMPFKYKNESIKLNNSDYHKVTIEEVFEDGKNYQVLVSNDSPNQVRLLLKREVPEIESGLIQIVSISRIKGERSKISFRKNPEVEQDIDIIGSIVGPDASRINRVVQEWGEKIDIVIASDNIYEYISNALSPAKIVSINKKQNNTATYLVVVPDKHNSLAIGAKGSNVKLAVELLRVNLDICSYSYAEENNVPILWNGNINAEEFKVINESEVVNNRSLNLRRNNNNNNNRPSIDISEFEKEMADYQKTISDFKSPDFSEFNFDYNNNSSRANPKTSSKDNGAKNKNFDPNTEFDFESASESILNDSSSINQFKEMPTKQSSQKTIDKANADFKTDSDLLSGLDMSDFDFGDFDDEDFK